MNCIFCKILNKEINSHVVYEDKNFVAILDAFPANECHILVIPKKHYINIFEIPENILKECYVIAQKISLELKKEFNIQNINILQNNGIIAGQTVDHFHIHIIPRYENDTVKIKSQVVEISEKRKKEISEKLINKFNLC